MKISRLKYFEIKFVPEIKILLCYKTNNFSDKKREEKVNSTTEITVDMNSDQAQDSKISANFQC